jgi:hypothetical protein
MAKRFLACYATHSFFTTFTTARKWFCWEQVDLFQNPQFQPTYAHDLTIMNGMDNIKKVNLFQNSPTQAVSVISFHVKLVLSNRHFNWHLLPSDLYLALLPHRMQFIRRLWRSWSIWNIKNEGKRVFVCLCLFLGGGGAEGRDRRDIRRGWDTDRNFLKSFWLPRFPGCTEIKKKAIDRDSKGNSHCLFYNRKQTFL